VHAENSNGTTVGMFSNFYPLCGHCTLLLFPSILMSLCAPDYTVILYNVNQLQEQAKKMEEKTEQLAGEVASLREALEKLVTHMATK